MKIEDYETAHALMNEKKEILILDKIFSQKEPGEFHIRSTSDFLEPFHGYNLQAKSSEELRRLIKDFCARRYREIDEEISKL